MANRDEGRFPQPSRSDRRAGEPSKPGYINRTSSTVVNPEGETRIEKRKRRAAEEEARRG